MSLLQSWLFLVDTWWKWLIYAVLGIGGYILYYYLVDRRLYKELDGKIYVKEGIGAWKEVMAHLKDDHQLSQSEINNLMLQARKLSQKQKGGK